MILIKLLKVGYIESYLGRNIEIVFFLLIFNMDRHWWLER